MVRPSGTSIYSNYSKTPPNPDRDRPGSQPTIHPSRPTAGAETPAATDRSAGCCCGETLHDLARSVEVLAACRDALRRPGGAVLVADENVTPDFVAPGSRARAHDARLEYQPLPARVDAEQPSAAIGTVIRDDTVRTLADDAGLTSTEVVDVDAGFFRLYRFTR